MTEKKIVTVKFARDPNHDPSNKVTGICPADENAVCTDVTGQHHSYLATDEEIEALRKDGVHITRIESV